MAENKKSKKEIDPALREKLLKETKNPFYGIRRTLWFVFAAYALLGAFIMITKLISTGGIKLEDALIQFAACSIFISLIFLDKKKDD